MREPFCPFYSVILSCRDVSTFLPNRKTIMMTIRVASANTIYTFNPNAVGKYPKNTDTSAIVTA